MSVLDAEDAPGANEEEEQQEEEEQEFKYLFMEYHIVPLNHRALLNNSMRYSGDTWKLC